MSDEEIEKFSTALSENHEFFGFVFANLTLAMQSDSEADWVTDGVRVGSTHCGYKDEASFVNGGTEAVAMVAVDLPVSGGRPLRLILGVDRAQALAEMLVNARGEAEAQAHRWNMRHSEHLDADD